MSSSRIALVTGASSGFGECIARQLSRSGFQVFGTSRNPDSDSRDWEMLSLDVTSSESIAQCVAEVKEKAGRIDLLVNNAGQSHCSFIEETPLENARQLFEVNFWGLAELTAAVLEEMRAQKAGHVIHISSLAGLVGTPGQGYYAATKHALEGYSETLHAELGHLPISISLVEPGFFRTPFDKAMLRDDRPVDDYNSLRDSLKERIGNEFAEGGDPEEVARVVLDLAQHSDPPFRTRVGKDANKIAGLKKWLPQKWFLQGVQRQFGLGKSGS